MIPAIREKAERALKYLQREVCPDMPGTTVVQAMDVTKNPVDSRWGNKGSVNQIAYVQNNINLQVNIGMAVEMLKEIISEPVPVQPEESFEDLVSDLCRVAYGNNRTWTWLRERVTRCYALEAERQNKTAGSAAGSIDMDRTTYRKYSNMEEL